ncbi:MAG: nitrate ABC transporter, permease protein, partial [Rhodocyclaceae bacterium]|nr:nitrate ABC transporter, permease protein [Rhodocyclaceae bacterium]
MSALTMETKIEEAATPAAKTVELVATATATRPEDKSGELFRAFLKVAIPPVFGLALLIGIWELVAVKGGSIPTPALTFKAAAALFSDPFYSNGPNDQGIGWNILSSLQRVGIGFGFAAAVGIPLGFMLGRFKFMSSMFDP